MRKLQPSPRCPQGGVASTDRAHTAVLGWPSQLAGHMTLIKRIAQRAKTIRTAVDAGMTTAEYAVGTVAACAFAALLYKVITSTQVLDLLTGVVSRALHVPF
jgi:hypothetical protein